MATVDFGNYDLNAFQSAPHSAGVLVENISINGEQRYVGAVNVQDFGTIHVAVYILNDQVTGIFVRKAPDPSHYNSSASLIFSIDGISLPTSTALLYISPISGGMNLDGLIPLVTGGNDNIYGNNFANVLISGAGNDFINGYLGADTMSGGTGNDTYIVGDAGDLVTESLDSGLDIIKSYVSYTLPANVERLTLLGTALNATGNEADNRLVGNAFNNTLDGGLGNDALVGGVGGDIYIVDSTGDVVTESLNAGTDIIKSYISRTLPANVERLLLIGTADVDAIGNMLSNILTGNDGINSLSGSGGNDTLNGGGGNDMLNGGAGNDKLIGGMGDDTYTVNVTADVVTEGLDAGTDIIFSPVSRGLSNNVENLTLTGTAAISGTGNALNNLIIGNAAANTLNGLGGDDTLNGENGNDIIRGGEGNDILSAGDGNDIFLIGASSEHGTDETLDGGNGTDTMRFISVTAGQTLVLSTLISGLERVFISNSAGAITGTIALNVDASAVTGNGLVMTGNAGANVLTGTGLEDTLNGSGGNDTLNGGDGNDILIGGVGRDIQIGDTADDIFLLGTGQFAVGETIDGGAGNDTLRFTGGAALVTTTLNLTSGVTNVENIAAANSAGLTTGTFAVNINAGAITTNGIVLTGNNGKNILTGTGLIDTLIGNSGNDTLNGGAGDDTMNGGAGNDTYVVDSTTDIVQEDPAAGVDKVTSSATFALPDEVEALTLTGTAEINGTGNGMNNILTGNSAANMLDGGDGNDALTGGADNDTLTGGMGNDTLAGNAGNDILMGGDGNDRFIFNTALSASTNVDTLQDFSSGMDKLVLDKSFFASLTTPGALASGLFYASAGAVAHDANDRIIYDTSTGNLYYDSNGNAAGGSVLIAQLDGAPTLTAGDISVVT